MKRIAVFFSFFLIVATGLIKISAQTGSLSVDLGQDYYTVPANTSTEIPSTVSGNVVSYTWTQVSGPGTATLSNKTTATLKASNLMVDKTYSSQGRVEGYVFRLTVKDAAGNTAFDDINVKLTTPVLGSKIKPYTYIPKTKGWDTSPYLSYSYGLPFRMLFPRDYKSRDNSKKYPLILAIHGKGENGTDNDYQLKNGGKIHMEAVQDGRFEGIVIFPQYNNPNSFPYSSDLDKMTSIVNELIALGLVDVNRVHVHGLSSGGSGTWDMIIRHPKVYASAKIFSWSLEKYRYPNNLAKYIHLPLWVSQGGKDTGPPPGRTNDLIKRIRNAGVNVRYLYFPNHAHNTWDPTYKKSDFFSTFMAYRKSDIHVYFDQTTFCEGDEINVRLGLTAGYADYEWQKDGMTIHTGVNEITVTEEGIYRARFKRGSTWNEWSKEVPINRQRDPSPTPTVTTRKKSTHLPSLDGKEEVTLYGKEGYAQYFWHKNGQLISDESSHILTVSEAGTYTLTAIEPDGVPNEVIPDEYRVQPARCESLSSAPIVVTTKSGPDAPQAPVNLFAYIKNANSIELKFEDKANNELGFEIYRSNQSGGPYTLIDIINANNAANPVSYIDANLKDNTQYFYKIRAFNNDGGSPYSNEAKATTPTDEQAPSIPQNLRVTGFTTSSISLKWDASTDNVGVSEYLIFQDGVLIASSTSPEYVATGLSAQSSHTYKVKAKDAAGNISDFSNQVVGAAINSGLFYTYYHVSSISTVKDIVSKGTKIKTGRINNFLLDPRERDTNYAFIYEGYIYIETEATYTFYLKSDDGSRLYIDGQEIVNHDGGHGCSERSGNVALSPGVYPIKVDYYQGAGSACLEVRWEADHISKQLIPDVVLRDDYTFPAGPEMPSSLQLTVISYRQINLSWTDQSNDETGFEVYRSDNANGPFHIIHTTQANETAYADTTLAGNTTYYYKIRAISDKGVSAFSEVKSAQTLSKPNAPAAPDALKATAISSSAIRLDWSDKSVDETAFEIWRTTSSSGNGAALLQTVEANQTTYLDTALPGNTTLYYKLRAKGDGGYSAFTSLVSATTANNDPVLLEILSRTVQYSTTESFKIFVEETDLHDISSFEITGLPSFGSFVNHQDNSGTFTFSPDDSHGGSYEIQVKATDSHGGVSTRYFTLIVSNNATPQITPIQNQKVSQGSTADVEVDATDADGNTSLKLSLANHPDFVTIVDKGSGKGVITIKPGMHEIPGEYPDIQVIAEDQQGGVGTYTFDLFVKAVDKDFTLYINFSEGRFASFPWNNTGNANSENQVLGAIYDEEGSKTGMTLRFRNDNDPSWFSKRTTVDSELYPEDVKDTRYASYSSPITMTMSGLNPLLNYNFTFFGSSNESGGDNKTRITTYSVGGKTGEVETYHNTDKTVNLTNIRPDANGEVQIVVNRKSLNDWIMVVNAMVVEGFLDDGSVPAAPASLTAKALSPTRVQLNWLDNSKNEEGFEILKATHSNGPFTVVSATQSSIVTAVDENLTGRTTYFYKVRAFNAHGKSAESNIATVITPNSPPVLGEIANVNVKVGETSSIKIKATDAENDAIRLEAQQLPPFAHFVDQGDGTGVLTLAPASVKYVGSYTLKVIATDDRNDTDEKEMVVMVSSSEYEEEVYINFSDKNAAGSPWNNTNNRPAANQVYNGLKNASGNASAVFFTVLNGWTRAENFGVNTGNNSGVYADAVISSYWKASDSAAIRFSGLSPEKVYNFTFFASNDTIAEATASYTIGNSTASLNAAHNSQKTTRLNGIVPDANGEVTVIVNAGTYARGIFLGAVVLQSYDANVLVSPGQLSAEPVSRTQIRLQWIDNAGNETGYRVYRSTTPYENYDVVAVLDSNVSTYLDKGLTRNTTYFYKVQAVKDQVGSDFTNTASATTFEYMLYINFVGNDPKYTYPASPWNNTKTALASEDMIDNLKDDTGADKGIQLYVEEWPIDGGDNNLGIKAEGIYPAGVSESFYFLETNTMAKFDIQNLEDKYHYSFIFFNSGDGNIDLFKAKGNLTTDFRVGQQTVTLNALNNLYETVQINDIVANSNSAALLEINAHVFTPAYSAEYAIFNAMVIGAYSLSDAHRDNIAPTAPADLQAKNIAPDAITLQWTPSTDNSGSIAFYEIYNGNQLMTVAEGSSHVHTVLPTEPSKLYNFSVVAVDESGNKSIPSKTLSFSYEILQGLNYAYYEDEWSAMPDYDTLTAIKVGHVDNFSLSPKKRDQHFGFRFYGFIKIEQAGDYTFYTKSNTGSKLYIDGQEIVQNDIPDNSAERSGTAYKLSSGYHAILVDYRNATEAAMLEVYYKGPGVAKTRVPDHVLYRTAIVAPVPQPVEFVEVKATWSSGEVLVEWTIANEFNNQHFIIEKSYDLDIFAAVGQVNGAGNSVETRRYQFSDTHLRPGMVYYRIRQSDFDGHGKYSKVVSVHILDHYQLTDALLFPNPTSRHNVNIKVVSSDFNAAVQIAIMDMVGKIIYQQAYSAGEMTEGKKLKATDGLKAGTYVVRIEQGSQTIYRRIIIQE